ncbi:MAG TPA: hypothetical protein VK698_32850 [Kofleriaceae bacterium]|nr:hypothetical protein [Kofleriaceae bacterium]
MRRAPSQVALVLLFDLAAGGLAGCADDPIYVQPSAALELVPGEGDEAAAVTAQLVLPVRLEREDEAAARTTRSGELGIQVPYVTRDDLDLSIEWTIKNLDQEPGVARIQVNGANEFFTYVPTAFVTDPEDEEEPPPLVGNVPLEIPAGGERSGVFQEDLLAEASLDLELITRGGRSPFAALLKIDEYRVEIDASDGTIIPGDAFASLVRFDLAFLADRHMVLEYAVRVRDHRDPPLLHDELTDAPPDQLTAFAPADFAPPPE